MDAPLRTSEIAASPEAAGNLMRALVADAERDWDLVVELAAAALDLRDRALASAGNGIVIGDAAKRGFPIVYVNPAWERITGWPAAQALGQSCAILQGPETDAGDVARIAAALRRGEACQATLLNYRAGGSEFWNELTLTPILGASGAPAHVVGVLEDVTERRARLDRLERLTSEADELRRGLADAQARCRELAEQIPAVVTPLRRAESALREERDRAQSYLDVARTIIVVVERDEHVALLNRTGHALLGHEDGELIGRNWFEACVPAEDRDSAREKFHRIMAGETEPADETVEGRVLTGSGERRDIAWGTTVLRGEDGEPTATLSSGIDISERRRAEDQIAHLAYHDTLTGLPNRALLHEHLDLALARARRSGRSVALLYMDLDDFKLVNDSFGHAAGDELLHQVGQRLSRRRRAADLLVRQGGDEFLLLISDIEDDPVHVAVAAAEGMLSAVSEPFALGGAEFHLGASIGLSAFPRDAPDADALLRHADQAMYQAKASGRGNVRPYSGGAVAEPLERLSMTSRLRRAIAQDEFVLHWQPIFGLDDAGLYGLEALVRWEDPQRGRVPPLEFIGVAEETGLIDRIGEWVAEAVCRQRLEWQASGLDPIVTLNVSPRELRRADFAERMLERVGRHGLDPGRMVVELTETAAMAEQARTEPLLERLAAGGIRVAIDDFGAGYSSLARLRELPVHVLKVERRFLADVPDQDDASAVVTAILDLGAALGMDVVVEGVETEEQRAFLHERGCRLAQGFLLGRPAPAVDLADLLRAATLTSVI